MSFKNLDSIDLRLKRCITINIIKKLEKSDEKMSESKRIINLILEELQEKDLFFQKNNKFDFSGQSLKKWKRFADYTSDLLNSHKADYVLIKAYDIPYAIMDDLDILLERKDQLIEIYKDLKKRGFLFKHVTFNDKFKLSAMNKKLEVEIDFYPDPKWSELRYANKDLITKNRKIKSKHDCEFYCPRAEHEICITASHSYQHNNFNLLDVLNTIKLLIDEKPSMSEIILLSEKFHMQNATLFLLSTADKFMKRYEHEGIKAEFLDKLRKISNKRFQKISSQEFYLDDFPIRFSVMDLLCASLDKLNAKNLDKSVNSYDELMGFLKHNKIMNKVSEIFSNEFNDVNFLIQK